MKFACTTCSYETSKKYNLQRHVLSIHENTQRKHRCNLCSYSSHHLQNIKIHMNAMHKDVIINKISRCSLCDFSTAWPGNMRRHIEKEHSINMNVLCNICNRRSRPRCKICANCIQSAVDNYSTFSKHRATRHAARRSISLAQDVCISWVIHNFSHPVNSIDKRIYGQICGDSRPDMLFACPTVSSRSIACAVEIDENEHRYVSGGKRRESDRMKFLIREIPEAAWVFIRFNPDDYEISPEKKSKGNASKKSLRERLLLLRLVLKVAIEEASERTIHEKRPAVWYLFYSDKNTLDYSDSDFKVYKIFDKGDLTRAI